MDEVVLERRRAESRKIISPAGVLGRNGGLNVIVVLEWARARLAQ